MLTTNLGAQLRLLTIIAVTLAISAGLLLVPSAAAPAEAAVSTTTLSKVVKIAASRKGSPYQYGAAGPRRFDCSGLVQYSYRAAGKKLPRSTTQQASATRRITKSQARPGDLVFFHTRGRAYHVGVYAGSGYVWHAPKRGDVVRKAKIWTGSVFYGRVR